MTGLWRRVLEILRRRQLDRESAEELAHHVEMLVARKVEAGIDEAEARRQVRIEVGTVESAREQIAEGRTGFALEQLRARDGLRRPGPAPFARCDAAVGRRPWASASASARSSSPW